MITLNGTLTTEAQRDRSPEICAEITDVLKKHHLSLQDAYQVFEETLNEIIRQPLG